ncbi:MAG: hypothetical protein EBT79_11915 [Actinobacteria bacterium]|nr:hypothetical protein [Actinomycetota bacterium]NBR67951.1 hypothetical protein [Actinomycetota bacterium]
MSELRPRRPTSWAVIELTRLGERKAEDGTLAPLLRDALSLSASHPVFIPSKSYTTGGRRVTIHLMEGYAFVASDGTELPYISRTDQPYVKRMLTTPTPTGSRVLSVVADAVVLDMEANLAKHVGEEAQIGTWVSVNSGLYANMDGEVVDSTSSGNLVVRFRMRSLDAIVEVPRSFTVPCDGAE